MKLLKRLRTTHRAVWTGWLLVGLAIFLQFAPFNFVSEIFTRAEGIIYDLRLNATLEDRTAGFADVIILDVDERTMDEIGWPWPRAKLATVVNNLADAGAVVVAFDVLFAEPERNPAAEVYSQLQQRQQNPDMIGPLVELMDGDLAFAQSFDATDVMLGFLMQDDVSRGELPTHEILSDRPIDKNLSAISYNGYVTSLPKLHDAAAGEGFINSSPDQDGYLRRSALVTRYQDKLYPSLSLEAARLYALAEEVHIKTEQAGAYNNIKGVIIGNQLIPTDAEGRVLIPYRGPQRSFPYISALDVLNNDFDPTPFEGAVVFVGTSAVGLVDLRSTPVGLQYPGVEVHANVFEGLLKPELLKYRPDWWQAAVALYMLLMGLILASIMPFLGPTFMALAGFLGVLGTVSGNVWLWNHSNISLPMTSSLFMVLLITTYNIGRGFFVESQKRQQIKSIFNQYVPPAHIDRMLDSPEDVSMDGEKKELSVLFSDIRSFTSISEKLSANDLKKLLNRYFDPITESIFLHHGTIDKYVGDMVMAFWGAPLDDPKHAQQSVETAFDMLRITRRLSEGFIAEGWPEIKIGVGINTGDMNVGDMGSSFRRAYTVLGDAVNLGSRLEGLTKFYGVECLVSKTTMLQCEGIKFRRIDNVKVKGKDEAVAIYEPLDPTLLTEQKWAEVEQYHKAYDFYLKQDWKMANEAFQQLAKQSPQDILYTEYLNRIEFLETQNLAEDWDGSFTHTSK